MLTATLSSGWFGLSATEAGRRLLAWPDFVHQFHKEGFGLPAGATLLAEGAAETFPNQAFCYGEAAFGIPVPHRTDHGDGRPLDRAHRRSRQAARRPDPAMHFQGRALHDWKTAAFLDAFLDLWLKRDRRAPAAIPEAAE